MFASTSACSSSSSSARATTEVRFALVNPHSVAPAATAHIARRRDESIAAADGVGLRSTSSVSTDDDDDDDETDARARARAWARLPTKTKCLGPTLLALGTAMLGTRALFALGAIEADAHAARGTTTALTVVGGMCALAGGYATTVMWMTARGARGWSYEMIPGE